MVLDGKILRLVPIINNPQYKSSQYVTEPEIAVGHWPYSDQFQDLAVQN